MNIDEFLKEKNRDKYAMQILTRYKKESVCQNHAESLNSIVKLKEKYQLWKIIKSY